MVTHNQEDANTQADTIITIAKGTIKSEKNNISRESYYEAM